MVLSDYPTEELDPSTPTPNLGSKVGIDATRKLPEEYGGKQYPEDAVTDPAVEGRVGAIVEEILRRWGQ